MTKPFQPDPHQFHERSGRAKTEEIDPFAIFHQPNCLVQCVPIHRFEGLGQVIHLGNDQALKDIPRLAQLIQPTPQSSRVRDTTTEIFLQNLSHSWVTIKTEGTGKSHKCRFT